ncbi:C-type lectin lectoxin-Thr1-like [Pogona vitticeps]
MRLTSSYRLHHSALQVTIALLVGWSAASFLTLNLHSSRIARAPKKAPPGVKCLEGWMTYKECCYGFFTEMETWWDAEEKCRYSPAARTHLASILDDEEMDAVANFITPLNQEYNNYTHPVWIGLYNQRLGKSEERNWWWMDSFKTVYVAWARGEPNNDDTWENCVTLLPRKGYKKWNDDNCFKRFPYLCKYELKYQ